jgi:hypothetical protein
MPLKGNFASWSDTENSARQIWSALLELCQREREKLDKESVWDEERNTSQNR